MLQGLKNVRLRYISTSELEFQIERDIFLPIEPFDVPVSKHPEKPMSLHFQLLVYATNEPELHRQVTPPTKKTQPPLSRLRTNLAQRGDGNTRAHPSKKSAYSLVHFIVCRSGFRYFSFLKIIFLCGDKWLGKR